MQTDTTGAAHAPTPHDDRNSWSDFIDILSETSFTDGHGLTWLIDRMTMNTGEART